MRRSTASELRMLREIVWHFGTIKKCRFCKKPLLDATGLDLKFGERQFPPVKTKLTTHHENGDHEDDSPENRKPCHQKCHKSWHLSQRHKQNRKK